MLRLAGDTRPHEGLYAVPLSIARAVVRNTVLVVETVEDLENAETFVQ